MKRAHYLQHVPFEGLGVIETWLQAHEYQISRTPLYESSAFPDAEQIDLLIIMGGPMSINDEQQYPWLRSEKAFIKECLQQKKPILGICLGAQLIASVCGAQVYPNPQKEIGWFPIQNVSGTDSDLFQFEDAFSVFHWHGETFDLPAEANWLACSDACLHQAFNIGQQVVGLQFHIETTLESAGALIENCRDELIEAPYVHSAEAILADTRKFAEAANQALYKLLDTLTSPTAPK